jgi:hypothetical protein
MTELHFSAGSLKAENEKMSAHIRTHGHRNAAKEGTERILKKEL